MDNRSTTLWINKELLLATDSTLEMLRNQFGWSLSRHSIMKEIVEAGLDRFNETVYARLPSLARQMEDGSE